MAPVSWIPFFLTYKYKTKGPAISGPLRLQAQPARCNEAVKRSELNRYFCRRRGAITPFQQAEQALSLTKRGAASFGASARRRKCCARFAEVISGKSIQFKEISKGSQIPLGKVRAISARYLGGRSREAVFLRSVSFLSTCERGPAISGPPLRDGLNNNCFGETFSDEFLSAAVAEALIIAFHQQITSWA